MPVQLNLRDGTDFSSKFGPLYMGPRVDVERFINGEAYRVRDLSSGQERQVTREQLKVMDVPSEWEKAKEPWLTVLPRLGRVESGEGVLVPQVTPTEESVNSGDVLGGERPTRSVNKPEGGCEREGDSKGSATSEARGEARKDKEREPGDRYSLRQAPERRLFPTGRRCLTTLQKSRRGRLGFKQGADVMPSF